MNKDGNFYWIKNGLIVRREVKFSLHATSTNCHTEPVVTFDSVTETWLDSNIKDKKTCNYLQSHSFDSPRLP